MSSGPNRSDQLSFDQLERILTQAFAALELKCVCFSGGEPTLLGDDLYRALRLCKEHGVITRVVTNAYWATSSEAALDFVRGLRDAGLDELNISTDDYHLPFISLQRVRFAYEAALRLDFLSVAITNSYGPESSLTPERLNAEFGGGELKLRFDVDGRSLGYDRQDGQTLLVLSNAPVSRLGTGIDGLEEHELPQGADVDALADRIGGCQWAIRSAAISAKGHLVSCCGFDVQDNEILDYGDLDSRPLTELLDAADNDLISNMIAILGPPRIRRMLEQLAPGETDFPRAKYSTYCEVCTDLVTRPRNREALYRHQGEFVEAVVAAREWLASGHTGADGRIRVPKGAKVPFGFELREEAP